MENNYPSKFGIDYYSYPVEHSRDCVYRWIEHGIQPGSFMTALLSNDLKRACECADEIHASTIFEIVKWLYNRAPTTAWGRPNILVDWPAYLSKRIAVGGENDSTN